LLPGPKASPCKRTKLSFFCLDAAVLKVLGADVRDRLYWRYRRFEIVSGRGCTIDPSRGLRIER